MAEKFRNKYRIPSARMRNWDYGWNASYFVTICTGGRQCYFGDINDEQVILSEIGILADKFWLEIPDHFPHVKLDEHIIMPNHIHGIIIIEKNDVTNGNGIASNLDTGTSNSVMETPKLGVSTGTIGGKNDKWKSGVLGVIINQFKRICTIESRKINAGFVWQSRFHDHIIRDQKSLDNIRAYIRENPKKWKGDELNPNSSDHD